MEHYIEKNLKCIKEKIKLAAIKSGRDFEDITLVGVTKTIDIEKIAILKKCGIIEFGENKAQEFLQKYDEIHNCNWHFIGQLQTNKVKQIIDKVYLIHSVDNLKLIQEIDKRAKEKGKIMDILLQINIADEPTKGGLKFQETKKFVKNILNYTNIRLKGLMCIPPFQENPQNNRKYFKKMKKLFIDINEENKDNIYMEYLSMGMTNDYEIAIEEGSNMVRIGTAIFGKRNY